MNHEDRERLRAKIRGELSARLLAGLDEKVERVIEQIERDEQARIEAAIASLLGPRPRATSKGSRGKKAPKTPKASKTSKASGDRGCKVCGYERGRARGRWRKPHSRDEHRAAVE